MREGESYFVKTFQLHSYDLLLAGGFTDLAAMRAASMSVSSGRRRGNGRGSEQSAPRAASVVLACLTSSLVDSEASPGE